MIIELNVNSTQDISEDSVIFFNKAKNGFEIVSKSQLLKDLQSISDNHDLKIVALESKLNFIEISKVFERLSALESYQDKFKLFTAYNLLVSDVATGTVEDIPNLEEIKAYCLNPTGDIPTALVAYLELVKGE